MIHSGNEATASLYSLIIFPKHKKFISDQYCLLGQALAEGSGAAEHAGQVGEVRVAWAEITPTEKVQFCAETVDFFVFLLPDRPTTICGLE